MKELQETPIVYLLFVVKAQVHVRAGGDRDMVPAARHVAHDAGGYTAHFDPQRQPPWAYRLLERVSAPVRSERQHLVLPWLSVPGVVNPLCFPCVATK